MNANPEEKKLPDDLEPKTNEQDAKELEADALSKVAGGIPPYVNPFPPAHD